MRTNSFTVIFWTVFLLFLPYFSISQSLKKIELRPRGELAGVKLQPDYAYQLFHANSDILVWYEGYTNTLTVYNLIDKSVNQIKLKKGRGPNEVQGVFDLFITHDKNIFLLDFNNAKFIRLTQTGKFLEDLPPPSGFHPIYVEANNKFRVIMDTQNREAIFYIWQKNNRYIPVELLGRSATKEFPNLFAKEGRLTIQGKYLIHLTKYYPYLYIYNLEKKELAKKIIFDESEVEESKTSTRSDGARLIAPPAKVDILNEDVAYIPGTKSRIFLLAKGKSDERDYELNTLYEYDFMKEEFIGKHNLGVKAEHITVYDNYLFVYSREENKIFQYEIEPSE